MFQFSKEKLAEIEQMVTYEFVQSKKIEQRRITKLKNESAESNMAQC